MIRVKQQRICNAAPWLAQEREGCISGEKKSEQKQRASQRDPACQSSNHGYWEEFVLGSLDDWLITGQGTLESHCLFVINLPSKVL